MKKVILVGDTNTGKSTFLSWLRQENNTVVPTIGVDCFKYRNMQIWDTSGHSRFKVIIQTFFSKMHAFVLIYNTREEFLKLDETRKTINRMQPFHKKIIIIYNGEDIDLSNDGYLYAFKYKLEFFPCVATNKNDSIWTWNRINNILTREERIKGWRYCWFY